jgi:tripartite ATP-independent transporter DctP family solute receptor
VFKLNVLLACSLLVVSAHAQPVKLKAWTIHPENYPVTQALLSLAQEIKKSTGGRYEIEVINSGGGITPEKAQELLLKGELDFTVSNAGPLSQVAPGIKVLNLPFLFTNSDHMFKHLDGALGAQFASKLEAANFNVLGWYDGGARSFYCIQPVKSISDFAGKRIRVQQSEVYLEMVKLIGGKASSVPFKEVQAAFQDNKIDCAENNMPSYESTGHYKVAKNMFVTNHVIAAEALLISPKLLASLKPDDKKIFSQDGKKSALLMRELWKKRVALSQEIATKDAVKFVRLKDPASLVRKLGPLYGKYMNDPATRAELLTIISN